MLSRTSLIKRVHEQNRPFCSAHGNLQKASSASKKNIYLLDSGCPDNRGDCAPVVELGVKVPEFRVTQLLSTTHIIIIKRLSRVRSESNSPPPTISSSNIYSN